MDAATLARRLAARGFTADFDFPRQTVTVTHLHPAHVPGQDHIRRAVREEDPGAREQWHLFMYGRREGEPDSTTIRFDCSGRPAGGSREFLPGVVGL